MSNPGEAAVKELGSLSVISGRQAIRLAAIVLLMTGGSCRSVEVKPAAEQLFFCGGGAVNSVSIGSTTGTQTSQVIDLPQDATCPVWSPDGRLALLYQFRIVGPTIDDRPSLIDRQNGTVQELHRFDPRDVEWTTQWRPDGISLLLLSARDSQDARGISHCVQLGRSFNGTQCWVAYSNLYMADVKTGDGLALPKQIDTLPQSGPICELAWSLPSNQVAFARGRGCTSAATETSIDVLDLRAHRAVALIDSSVDGVRQSNATPRWSPDGKHILFSALRMPDNAPWSTALFEGDLDSGEIHFIINKEVQSSQRWSPDSKKVAWVAVRDVIGLTDIESGESRQWEISKAYNAAFTSTHSWSPNGRYFAWTQWDINSNEKVVFILDLLSDQITTIPDFRANSWAWSSNSDWLAFSVLTPLESDTCEPQIDVYIVRPDGTELRHITEGQQLKALPCAPGGWRGYRLEPADVQWVP